MSYVAPNPIVQNPEPMLRAMRDAGEGIRRDLQRAEDMVKDAVGELLGSFKGLYGMVQTQRELLIGVTATLREGTGTPEGAGFASAVNQLLGRLVDDVVGVSRDSLKMISQLTHVSSNIDEIVHRTQGIDRLARETRFVALNARIETHKAGDAGRTFKVVADEVKRLAQESADLSAQIRIDVEKCQVGLAATRQTAEALAAHDMTTSLESRKRIGSSITCLEEVSRALASTLARVSDDVEDAVRALQFEETVRQMLAGASRKIELYEALCCSVVTALATGGGGPPDSLGRIEADLRRLGNAGGVGQATMSAGAVEVF